MSKTTFLLLIALLSFQGEALEDPNHQAFEAEKCSSRNLLFPFYTKDDDPSGTGDLLDGLSESRPEIQLDLPFQLPFYGYRFDKLRVSIDGYVGFSDQPTNPPQYPLVFPIKNYPNDSDPSFIGVFYTKARLGLLSDNDTDQRPPGVYFRVEPNLNTRQDELAKQWYTCALDLFDNGITGGSNFRPKNLIVVTWKNISFAGGISPARSSTNTFQLVLATDEVYTYAVFSYDKMDWTSHTEAGGDTLTGLGGVPAFIGFNAGNGTGSFEYYVYSQKSNIKDILRDGFTLGVRGKHIFRIDELVDMGSCQPGFSGFNLPLLISPSRGSMLGGTLVNVTGPCFDAEKQYYCRFGEEIVNLTVVSTNKGICQVPLMPMEGLVYVEVTAVDGLVDQVWKTKFFLESPASSANEVFFTSNAQNEKSPKEITIAWNYNNFTSSNVVLSLSLWGYRETNTTQQVVYIDQLADNIQNTGQYRIVPGIYRNRNNSDLLDVRVGFLQINTTSQRPVRVMWSDPMPLGWYFGPQLERISGENWTHEQCKKYMETDQIIGDFQDELPTCPCTLNQALADKGRFYTDPKCDKDSDPECPLNRQALHCIKSLPSINGAEQQCCYDKLRMLMLTQDQIGGSYPSRTRDTNSHNVSVPTLGQWHHDIAPRYPCCLYENTSYTDCYQFRYEMRPSRDCKTYKGPGVAAMFGDPHVITFSGYEYTFNGLGDFVLVKAEAANESVTVQGRFVETGNKTTSLKSVVVKGSNAFEVEVRFREENARWRYHLEVFVNLKRVYFDRIDQRIQMFNGGMVYVPSNIFNQSDIVVMLDSGAGVEIKETKGVLNPIVFLPEMFKNNVTGLFGLWEDNPSPELTTPDGTIVPLQNLRQIYYDFALKWMVGDDGTLNPLAGKSLFYKEYGRTADYYNDIDYVPPFPSDNSTLIMQESEDSFVIEQIIKQIRRDAATEVTTCGLLETPLFGVKDTFLNIPAVAVILECFEGYTLQGDAIRRCLMNGEWSPLEIGETVCTAEGF